MPARKKEKEAQSEEPQVEAPPRPRMKDRYQQEIVEAMTRRFGYRQVMEVPRLSKVVVSMGVGAATQDPKILDSAMKDLAIITGQQPVIIKAR